MSAKRALLLETKRKALQKLGLSGKRARSIKTSPTIESQPIQPVEARIEISCFFTTAMNFTRIINGSVTIVGLLLIGYSYVAKKTDSLPGFSFSNSPSPTNSEPWVIKSVYDGDTLRLVRGNEELKIRFCGTDSPVITTTILSYLI